MPRMRKTATTMTTPAISPADVFPENMLCRVNQVGDEDGRRTDGRDEDGLAEGQLIRKEGMRAGSTTL